MKVRIKSIGIGILTEEWERFDREKFLNISQEVANLVLYGAEIKSVYYDEKGRYGLLISLPQKIEQIKERRTGIRF